VDRRSPLARTAWAGIVLILAGTASCAGRSIWLNTRNWAPVDMPAALARGETIRTPEFVPEFSGDYFIAISVDRKPSLDAMDATGCLLGVAFYPDKCSSSPVIDEDWVLYDEGKLAAKGSSRELRSGGGGFSRVIGYFHAERGQRYVLAVQVRMDGRELAAAHPHLRVDLSSGLSERYYFKSLSVAVGGIALIIVGTILLVVALLRRYWNQGVREWFIQPNG